MSTKSLLPCVSNHTVYHVDLPRCRAPHSRRRVRVKLYRVDMSRDRPQALGSVLDANEQPMYLEPELPLCLLKLVQELLGWDFELTIGDEKLPPPQNEPRQAKRAICARYWRGG